jgi:hypothetical protein
MSGAIKNLPTPQKVRYFQGRVVGVTVSYGLEYNDVPFIAERVVDVPEDQQVYAEEWTEKMMGDFVHKVIMEDGLMMEVLQRINDYKQEQDAQGD